MVLLDGISSPRMLSPRINSPHRKSQSLFTSSTFRKSLQGRDELGSWSTLVKRHGFLLVALVLLGVLCTIYLYFAVTLGSATQAKSSFAHGKLKFF